MTDSDRPRCQVSGCENDTTPGLHPFCSVSCWIIDQALNYKPTPSNPASPVRLVESESDPTEPELTEVVQVLLATQHDLRERVEHYEKLARKYLKQRDELGARLGILLPTNAQDEATVDAMLARPTTCKER